MKVASYYEVVPGYGVRCVLCPHHCLIPEGETGICGVRLCHKGELIALTYGVISSFGMDPIEKKPLKHFYPGKKIASFGSYGCNFKCAFCQNHHISQQVRFEQQISVERLVRLASEDPDCIGIAATYNEPTIQFEFVLDVFKANRAAGGQNVMVTNGFIEAAPLSELLPWVDAFNVDLKSYREGFYKDICKGRLAPVMESIKAIYGNSHLEVTLLLIPGLNDSSEELEQLFAALSGVSPKIPLHISRYFPNYKLNLPITPLETLERAAALASRYLEIVHIGNV